MKKLQCIMLVDDDSITNYINELLINEMGITHELLIASNGKEAMDIILDLCRNSNYCPDLILLDVNMPIMDGFQFLESYNELDFERKDSTIVVMVTTSLNPNDIEKARELNVKGYIAKPLLEKELSAVLDNYF